MFGLSYEQLCFGILAVLVVLVVYLAMSKKSGFEADPQNAYVLEGRRVDALQGTRNDGYRQDYPTESSVDRSVRKPESIRLAEREAWYAANESSAAADHGESFVGGGALDYSTAVTDLVVDSRARANHKKWANEVRPHSGVAMAVDSLDLSNNVHWAGLRRPQAVKVNNPQQLTELGPDDLLPNKRFNFNG